MRRYKMGFFTGVLRTIGMAVAALICYAVAAHAADGEFNFGKFKLTGSFVRDYNKMRGLPTIQYPVMYGQFNGDGDRLTIYIEPKSQGTDPQLNLEFWDEIEKLQKTPSKYDLAEGPGKAKMSYRDSKYYCSAKNGGTVTLTAFGEVDGTITGTFANVKWNNDECTALFGPLGSFKVKRGIDRE